jgi:mRNA interferase RelE/StbE
VSPRGAYTVEWTAAARRALARLPEKVAASAVEFIYGPLTQHPRRVGRPLRFELEGKYSAHRGDYRVIYQLDDGRDTVVIPAIGHRADVYRPP